MKKILSVFLGLVVIVSGMALATSSAFAQNVPSGCSSSSGYSTTTGIACNGTTILPAGCSSAVGFSSSTGASCNGLPLSYNGGTLYPSGCSDSYGYSVTTGAPCNGQTGTAPDGVYYYPQGCTSASGYSSVTGLGCTMIADPTTYNGVTYLPGCNTSSSGYSTLTGQACSAITGTAPTPALPVTGMGANVMLTILGILLSAGLVTYGVKKLQKTQ